MSATQLIHTVKATYLHRATGMVVDFIVTEKDGWKKGLYYKITTKGYLGDAWVNKFEVGHKFNVIEVNTNFLERIN